MLKKTVFAVLFLFAVLAVVLAVMVNDIGGSFNERQGELQSYQLIHDGIERSYDMYLPPISQKGAAVIFALHGSVGSGAIMRASTGAEFDELADQHGFIVVYPDGYERHWNDCRRSADYLANKHNIDDVGFFKKIIEHLEKTHAIDSKRVFVTGHSNGGHMTYRLALEAPELFASYAPISANLPVDENLDCEKSEQAVSIAIYNGTEDPINPYEGGTVELFGNTSRGHVLSTEQTAAYWRGLAGLSEPPQLIQHPERDGVAQTSVVEQRWRGKGIEVRLVTLKGSGHVVPSTKTDLPVASFLGGGAGDLDGASSIVEFFLKTAN